LIDGRDNIFNGPEANSPNTINASCVDGTAGTYHSDESLDRLRIATADGSPLAAGATVQIQATVWVYGSTVDYLDLYSAADATNPSWTFLGTVQATANGQQVLTKSFVLPAGPLQAIRGNWRFVGSASSCSAGAYDDRDDLVFAVQSAVDNVPPSATITAPASGALVHGVSPVTVNASDNVGVTKVDLLVDGAVNQTLAAPPYSFPLNTAGLSDGAHQLQAKAYDAAGNTGVSALVQITVDNTPPSVAISSPAAGATVSGTTNVTVAASDGTSGVAAVDFLLDGTVQTTVTAAPYTWAWNTTTATAGSHVLSATAHDVAGNVATSATISVTVNNCVPETDAAFCAALGASCGTLSGKDNCGNPRTVTSCGQCTAPNTCGGGGTPNVCGTSLPACFTAYSQPACFGYIQGTKVSSGGHNWLCSNGNCANCSWQPGCVPGATGCPWGVVWTDQGACK
jgi:hypothetical protein